MLSGCAQLRPVLTGRLCRIGAEVRTCYASRNLASIRFRASSSCPERHFA